MSKLNTSEKKYPIYGHTIGIIMPKSSIIRLPGDVGNATTFKFPVRYKIVENVDPDVLFKPEDTIEYIDYFIKAAQELENDGVRAITGGCGFMAICQKKLSRAVNVPIFTSSLIQVPMVHSILKKGQKVGIVTANSKVLSENHFREVGWSTKSVPVAIVGIDEKLNIGLSLSTMVIDSEESIKELENSIVKLIIDFTQRNPDIGAIVQECTNLPPYSYAIQKAVHLPVFDIVTLINWVYHGVTCKKYMGYL